MKQWYALYVYLYSYEKCWLVEHWVPLNGCLKSTPGYNVNLKRVHAILDLNDNAYSIYIFTYILLLLHDFILMLIGRWHTYVVLPILYHQSGTTMSDNMSHIWLRSPKWTSTYRSVTVSDIPKMGFLMSILVMSYTLPGICSDTHCTQAMYSESLVCIADMIRDSYPTCGHIDLTFERRICELRNTSDTRSLRDYASLVGQVSVCYSLVFKYCWLACSSPARLPRPWGVSIYRCRLTSIGIPMLKIRRSRDRLIFNVGIAIPWKDGLYIE